MKRFKALSIMLVLLIVSLTIIPSFASSEETTVINPLQSDYSNELNKIHFYFGSAEENETSGGVSLFSRSLTANEEDYSYIDDEEEIVNAVENMNLFCEQNNQSQDLIQVTVEFESQYDKTPEFITFCKERETLETMKDVRNFRKRLNAFSKQYHQKENEKNIALLEQFDYENITLVGYAPFVVMEMTRSNVETENLISLSEKDEVANISLSLNESTVENTSWNNALKEIEAYSTVDSGLLTGAGVRVGVLESGVCDISHENLSDKNITIDSSEMKITDHATNVTSVISLMAPEAELFVSGNTNIGLEWFIDNACDVVNCSFSKYIKVANSDGTYGYKDAEYTYSIDGLFDYHIRTSFISAVVAAGNVNTDNSKEAYNPEGQIRSPALAYNAITVGGLERKLGFFDYYLQYHEESCYKTKESSAKPEISALFEFNVPNIGEVRGTSFAAPMVTGAIALMIEKEPIISTPTVSLKSLIMSCANKTEDYSTDLGEFDDKVGSGSLDFLEMRTRDYVAYLYRNNVDGDNTANASTCDISISLAKNSELQASLAWFAVINKNATNNSLIENCYITNYDLRLYSESGELLCESALNEKNNVELIRYTAPTAGNYILSIYRNGTMPLEIEKDYIGVTYNMSD